MKTINDIRSGYLGFFEKNGHTVVPSSSLVPHNDPTLLFNNAGMNQFKDVFTGKENRDYTRAASSQKCVRAGGKHNDLENVGYTLRHHTFFEMLGNFSFGDYFKEEAISYAWELLTKDFALDKSRLLMTVYHTDNEAFDLWKKISGFSDDRILRIATKDNFWSMGDTGPCGPCTEIFYDYGDHIWGGPPGSADEDGDRFIEIWNNVFMQFEQQADGTQLNLPKPCVDTGMGLERISALLQTGTNDNYKTDIFQALIGTIADATGTPADEGDAKFSQRVIADHIRTCSFLIADGVLPSNEGRGYVLRRIMRRAMRHAHMLGAKEPLMHKLVPVLEGKMADTYPELTRANASIKDTLFREESRFKELLDNGLKLIDAETKQMSEGDTLDGRTAFKLYDTYGFPLDLTQDVLKNRKISVDETGFNAAMDEQRAKARASWSGGSDTTSEKIWFDIKDEKGLSDFMGYETTHAQGNVMALVKDGALVDAVQSGDEFIFVTNQTPFYGESGGQMGDKGTAKTEGGAVIAITDTQKKNGNLIVHIAKVESGSVSVGDVVDLNVDVVRRDAIRRHHSATHLLHEALRQRLGDHIAQKGSMVSETRLRFDFAHGEGLSSEDLAIIEKNVNDHILANTPVATKLMAIDDARDSGARALFGEKYDDEVRVVSMGNGELGEGKSYSVELCGGTHVRATGDIGLFKIVSEGSVSSGVRRIEALCGTAAAEYLSQLERSLNSLAGTVKCSVDELPTRIEAMLAERKAAEKEIARLRKELATGGGASAGGNDVEEINGVKFVGKVLDGFPPKDLKPMADELKSKIGSGVVTLIATNDGKASIVVGVTDDLTAKLSAVDLVKIGAAELGGNGGGGRPDMAQAGGTDTANANQSIEKIKAAL